MDVTCKILSSFRGKDGKTYSPKDGTYKTSRESALKLIRAGCLREVPGFIETDNTEGSEGAASEFSPSVKKNDPPLGTEQQPAKRRGRPRIHKKVEEEGEESSG